MSNFVFVSWKIVDGLGMLSVWARLGVAIVLGYVKKQKQVESIF